MRQLLTGRRARAAAGLLTPLVALGTAGVGSGIAAAHRPPRQAAHNASADASVGAHAISPDVLLGSLGAVSGTPRLFRRRGHRPATDHRPARGAAHSASVGASVISPNVLLGSLVTVHGTLRGRRRREHGLTVEELLVRRWVPVAHGRSLRDGRFAIRFRPGSLGSFALRVRETASRIAAPRDVVTVFHRVVASWYGPGGRTACGEQLTASTLGVASPTLPCGTRVTLRLGARSLTVPVIDRGPFVSGRDFDLTYATKLALGAGDVSVLWASR